MGGVQELPTLRQNNTYTQLSVTISFWQHTPKPFASCLPWPSATACLRLPSKT